MSDAAAVLLKVDQMREDKAEYEGWMAYQAQLAAQEKEAKKWGSLGGIIGAVAGFMVAGPTGMLAGWGGGRTLGSTAAKWDDYDENERFLTKEVFEGGKFDRLEMKEYVDTAKEYNKKARESLISQAVIDTIITAVGVKTAGGFMKGVEKEAWKSLSFGDKLEVAFTGKPGEVGARALDKRSSIDASFAESTMPVEGSYGATADVIPGSYLDIEGTLIQPPGISAYENKFGQDLLTAVKGVGKGLFVPGSDVGGISTINMMEAAKRGQISIADLLKLGEYGGGK
tara:strand:+ start:432 stop:1283 length:852 start_codon:yes stop_codon:yes gene_type:complete